MNTILVRSIPLSAAAMILVGLAAGCAPRSSATSTEKPAVFVLGCSPFLERDHKDELFQRVVAFLLDEVPLGSSLQIYDAYHLQAVTRVDVPQQPAFASTRTRANQFGPQIQAFKTFLAENREQPMTGDGDFTQAVRLPQFLEFVGDNIARSNSNLSILILGSPLYVDEKETSFSMQNGYFPSDGHLLASRERSVYGTREPQTHLQNSLVHLVYQGDPWANDLHRARVERFWSLFVKRNGGRWGAFCGDSATAFHAWRDPMFVSVASPNDDLDPTQTKIEMLRINRQASVTDWITRDLNDDPAPVAPSSTIGPMKIGIRWSENVDFDLYAAPSPRSAILFFDNPRIEEGYYFKDHRSSPDREFEFIEFESAVNLRSVEAYINFYEGQLRQPAQGEIRIEFENRIYSRPFVMRAMKGNQGRRGVGQDSYWMEIDIPAVLGLAPEQVAQQ